MSSAYEKAGFTNRDGILHIEDLSVETIAAAAGTPVYIYSTAKIREMLTEYARSFVKEGLETRVLYASKAFNTVSMLKLVQECGLGLDVVSQGEILTAIEAGFDMKKVVFHGNNKSRAELELAARTQVGTIVADNLQEARDLLEVYEQIEGAQADVLLRINPGISAHTHEYINTGDLDSKFGIHKKDMDQILELASLFEASRHLHFAGFHCHIGSQIFALDSFRQEVEVMMEFIEDFQKQGGNPVDTLDLGGGFASWYTEEDQPTDIRDTCRMILDTCASQIQARNLSVKRIWIEPGRSIAANAGCTLYTVGYTKQTPHKNYVFVDGGMSDNIRPALYQAQYSCDLATRLNDPKEVEVKVAGKCCESGDILVESAMLPSARKGDLLVVYTTGAYGYSMASRYNKLPVPGVLFVEGNHAWWAVEPEKPVDMLAKETSMKQVV